VLRSAPVTIRFACALLCALVLSLRLLSPPGFMPTWERGQLVITICPDAAAATVGHGMHRSHSKAGKDHQPCPFASAVSDSVADAVATQLPTSLAFGVSLVLGRTFLFERDRQQERPPPTGPPLPRLA